MVFHYKAKEICLDAKVWVMWKTLFECRHLPRDSCKILSQAYDT